jgi:hypothetical protein
LELKWDILLSTSAFKFNLRRCIKAAEKAQAAADAWVRRCRGLLEAVVTALCKQLIASHLSRWAGADTRSR